jgi:uncharacterized protein with von Willebrand factor type A (vWA) domain
MSYYKYIQCLPRRGVVATAARDRALGRFARAKVLREPRFGGERDLVGDVFFSMFKLNPIVLDEVHPTREVNKAIMNWAMEHSESDASKLATVANIPAATASAGTLWEFLTSEEAMAEALKQQEEAEEAHAEAMEAMREAADSAQEGDDDGVAAAMARAAELQEKAKAKGQAAAGYVEQLKENPMAQGMMGAALEKASETGKEVSGFMSSWGIEPGDVNNTMDVEKVIDLATESHEQTAKIAKLLGKLEGIAADTIIAVRSMNVGSTVEAEYTKDLGRIFPTERAQLSPLANPVQRGLAIERYVNLGLLGWRRQEDAKRDGNFIAMVDGSGSMRMRYSYGGKASADAETVAKALTLGIARALRKDSEGPVKRNYELHTFGTQSDELISVTSKDDWKAHVEWAKRFPGGGTDFDYAMRQSVIRLRTMQDSGVNCDLCFITDGYAHLSDEVIAMWREYKSETSARLIVVEIGGSTNETLRELSDMYVHTTEQDFEGRAEEILVDITSCVVRSESKWE